jgi:hypothetical protein
VLEGPICGRLRPSNDRFAPCKRSLNGESAQVLGKSCDQARSTVPKLCLDHVGFGIGSGVSLPRYGSRVGLRIDLFEACSAFTRVTACTLALSPYFVTRLTEGFSHLVTSMTAPVASGWSGCRVGLAPTGKRRLITAHAKSGPRAWRPKAVLPAAPGLAAGSGIQTTASPG